MKGWYVGLIIVVVAFGLIVVGGCSYANGVRNEGIARERQLSAQYLSNQNYLSAYVSGFYEQVGAVQAQGEVLNSILLDAVKGRYDGKGGGGFAINSPLFAAIVEAYPEAGVKELMANWGKVQDYITAGRAGYRATQDKLLDMLRSYDTWREQGFLKDWVVGVIGVPSERLEARIGDKKWTGEEARDKMYQIVLTSDARKAYETGEMEPLKVPSKK